MEIYHLTAEELQARINAILVKYSILYDFDSSDYCCSGCAYNQLGLAHGWDVAEAWDELEGYRFLLS